MIRLNWIRRASCSECLAEWEVSPLDRNPLACRACGVGADAHAPLEDGPESLPEREPPRDNVVPLRTRVSTDVRCPRWLFEPGDAS